MDPLLVSFNSAIQVHRGGGKGWRLPLLNTLLQWRDDGSLDVTVYRKSMHADQYLDFHSRHPPQVKRGLVKCLFNRTTCGRRNTILPKS